MNTAKEEVITLLDNLSDECTLEDVQYHLYVAEKIKKGIVRATVEGTLTQEEVVGKFGKWINR